MDYNGNNMIKIRKANKNDAKRIREIYSYYVLNTAITFDYDIPDVNYFMESIEKINNGKIGLTDSELIKALFMQKQNFININEKDTKQIKN